MNHAVINLEKEGYITAIQDIFGTFFEMCALRVSRSSGLLVCWSVGRRARFPEDPVSGK
jgi:hypothetical protein